MAIVVLIGAPAKGLVALDGTRTASSTVSGANASGAEPAAHFLSDAGVELDTDPGRIRTCREGEIVLARGDAPTWFAFVLSGTLEVIDANGLPSALIDAGSIVGEIGLLTHRPRSSTVRCRTAAKLWIGHAPDLFVLFDSDEGSLWLRKMAATRLASGIGPINVHTTLGRHATVRPALPSDNAAFRREIHALSRESIRKRFFSASVPPDSVIDYLLDADHFNHAVWAALDDSGQPVGSVRCIRSHDDPRQAELAVGLVDRVQGNGIGGVLVALIGQVALSLGITEITAEVLADNEPMKRLLRSPSTVTRHVEPGVVSSTLHAEDLACRLTQTSRLVVDQTTRSIIDGIYAVPSRHHNDTSATDTSEPPTLPTGSLPTP